ncbi:hypothetical protein KCV05_g14312, partial [Aureobasidium melanogenum]
MAPKFKNAVICFSGTFDNSAAILQKWTEANGGTYNRKLTSNTTHLVVSEANWRARAPEVKTALEDNAIKIVNYEWFDDKLRLSSRVTETKYLWPNLDAEQLKKEAKDAKAAEREQKRAEKEKERKKKESEKVDYAAAFMQHTNVVARVEDEETSEDEDSSEDSSAEQNKSLAQQFAKGAKQAKQDLMSDNHHIYMDYTGFVYDVVVTKASVELSRLEKASIILYETNAGPPQYYSVVVKIPEKTSIDDYDLTTVNNVNFTTAFKCMRDNFKVLTGVSWDNRIKKFSDGPSLAPLPRPNITVTPPAKNSPPGKLSKITKKGKLGKETTAEAEETPETRQKRLEAAFAAQKYRYRLPAEGMPRGTTPDGSHYAHQNKKSVYYLFGKVADRSAETLAAKEAKKEEIKRLRRMALKRQNQQVKNKPEVVVIDSDDEQEEEETAEEESEEEEEEEEEE